VNGRCIKHFSINDVCTAGSINVVVVAAAVVVIVETLEEDRNSDVEIIIIIITTITLCLQCFDAVGWAAGRASGL